MTTSSGRRQASTSAPASRLEATDSTAAPLRSSVASPSASERTRPRTMFSTPTKAATSSSTGAANTSAAVPTWRTTPPIITATRSPRRSASSRSWVTKTVVTPGLAAAPPKLVQQRLAGRLVEGAERLVQQQHLRLQGEGARQARALRLAARDRERGALRQMGDAEPLHPVPRPLPRASGARRAVAGPWPRCRPPSGAAAATPATPPPCAVAA